MALRALIVDDFKLFRQFLVSFLEQGYECQIFEASDREEIKKIDQLQPDLVLLDLGLPYLNGIEVCKCAASPVATPNWSYLSTKLRML